MVTVRLFFYLNNGDSHRSGAAWLRRQGRCTLKEKIGAATRYL